MLANHRAVWGWPLTSPRIDEPNPRLNVIVNRLLPEDLLRQVDERDAESSWAATPFVKRVRGNARTLTPRFGAGRFVHRMEQVKVCD